MLTYFSYLLGKYIRFNDNAPDAVADFYPGQVAKIVGLECKSGLLTLRVDFGLWAEFNDRLDPGTYFDKDGRPTLRWSQTSFYPKNRVDTLYLSPDKNLWNFDEIDERVALALGDGAEARMPGEKYDECLRWIRKALENPSQGNVQMARLHLQVMEGYSPVRIRAEGQRQAGVI